MEHRKLGRTGVSVSKLCLGTMMFGDYGNSDHDDSVRIIHRALDAGINFIDTADVYSQGESEEIVGKALAGGRRDDVVLATKAWFPMGDDPNRRGASRRWIIREVEDSLRRLGTDWIDLYQIHRFEPDTEIEETLGALTDLVTQGKVRYIGSSTFPASAIVEAQWRARDRRLHRYVCEQPPYSILARGIEAEVLPTCLRHGMGVIGWSPLNGGWLTGRWREGTTEATPTSHARRRLADRYDLSLPANQRKLEAAEALARLAEEAGMSLIEMAIAFVINHPAVTAAIIGPRTMEQLESQLPAADVVLDGALLDRIDAIVPPGTNVNPADGGWVNPALAPGGAAALGRSRHGPRRNTDARIGAVRIRPAGQRRIFGSVGPLTNATSGGVMQAREGFTPSGDFFEPPATFRSPTPRPQAPRDLLLAPVAVAIDRNLEHLRALTGEEIALEFDYPGGHRTREDRAGYVLQAALRDVDTHHWSAEITADGARLRLTGGSVSLDLGLSRVLIAYIRGGDGE